MNATSIGNNGCGAAQTPNTPENTPPRQSEIEGQINMMGERLDGIHGVIGDLEKELDCILAPSGPEPEKIEKAYEECSSIVGQRIEGMNAVADRAIGRLRDILERIRL